MTTLVVKMSSQFAGIESYHYDILMVTIFSNYLFEPYLHLWHIREEKKCIM